MNEVRFYFTYPKSNTATEISIILSKQFTQYIVKYYHS